MKQLTVTDFDGTLTVKDTFIEFARHAVGMPRLLYAALRSAPHLAAWKLGLIAGGNAKQKLFKNLYRGMDVDVFMMKCDSFSPKIDSMLRTDVFKQIESYVQAGQCVAIVSASVDQWIRPWAGRHGIDTVLSTELEVDADSRLTGRFATPNCYGPEKVRRIKQHFGDLAAYEITAFGDSKGGDGAMLGVADHAVWVKR